MTDLEMTRLCAQAMGIDVTGTPPPSLLEPLGSKVRLLHDQWTEYDPLHDDAQAMALEWWLIENCGALHFYRDHLLFYPYRAPVGKKSIQTQSIPYADAAGKRRSIVECVAKIGEGKA